jgi:hypothetical protein
MPYLHHNYSIPVLSLQQQPRPSLPPIDTMRTLTLLLLLGSACASFGQDATARSIYEKALAAKPSAEKLRFFSLDWSSSLSQAKVRAAEEKRPIVLVVVTNITAGCDFFTGHT